MCNKQDKLHSVQALMLTKTTSITPAFPVSKQRNWNHLEDLSLADLDYGTPGSVDLFLGADTCTFSRVVHHERRFGPSEPFQPSRPNLVGYCQEW